MLLSEERRKGWNQETETQKHETRLHFDFLGASRRQPEEAGSCPAEVNCVEGQTRETLSSQGKEIGFQVLLEDFMLFRLGTERVRLTFLHGSDRLLLFK